MKQNETMTTNSGAIVGDNRNVQTAGPTGPMLMQNVWYMEKLGHFNRERIPERVVHAKGSGAFGTFTVTNDITQYTKASIFAEVGKQTPLLVRFSTVAGERGAADTERDVRGFAIKFYTDQGNWDLVGNNTPVFFIRDPVKFPDFIHTQKRNPKTNLRSATAAWDFWSLSPESLHQVMILMSDRGIPRNYRQMHGFGSHTYSFINAHYERFYIKFHFKTMQGIANFTNREAEAIVAKNREYSQQDLYEHIESGDYPKWKLYVQIMPEDDAQYYKINPFDLTKVWPHKDYPLIEVGVMELNRNPDNYFEQIEQAAFNPANIVPGIGFSPDKMLQGRLFAYGDANRYRLGANFAQIPVNAPKCPVHNYMRDGASNIDSHKGEINYHPNSFEPYNDNNLYKEPPLKISGEAYAFDHRKDCDYYSQPGALYRLLPEEEKCRLIHNVCESMDGIPTAIKIRAIARFFQADKDCGLKLANAMLISPQIIEDEVERQKDIDSKFSQECQQHAK